MLLNVLILFGKSLWEDTTRMTLFIIGVSLPFLLCPLCNQVVEKIHHQFVERKIASQVWSIVSR